jgi:hypothetical protein
VFAQQAGLPLLADSRSKILGVQVPFTNSVIAANAKGLFSAGTRDRGSHLRDKVCASAFDRKRRAGEKARCVCRPSCLVL